MKYDLDWHDLRLFLAVARAGGLNAAARATKVSAPTLGRRMGRLEQALGQPIFTRLRDGYRLTPTGEEVFDHATEVEKAVASLDRWRAGRRSGRAVRVAAGTWTSVYLARNIATLWRADDPFTIEFVTATARADIGRRAADIGLRNARPDERWLAARKVGTVAFAAYAAPDAPAEPQWIGIAGNGALTPSARWIAAHHAADIALWANSPVCAHEIARAGGGAAVLPCFIGDRDDRLERRSEPIADLQHDRWLVAHHDDRHDPSVRSVIDRIVDLVNTDRALMTGEGVAA